MQKTKGKREIWLIGLVMLGVVLCLPKFAIATATTNLLIAESSNRRVIEVDPLTHNVLWQYGQTGVPGSGTNQLNKPTDAKWLVSNTILIVDNENNRVIEVQPTVPSGGTIVWECGPLTGLSLVNHPYEAVRMSNGNTLITGEYPNHMVIEVQTGDYPHFGTSSIMWQQTYSGPLDVEEIGIINIAKAEYQDVQGNPMEPKFASVIVPIGTPTVNLPEIELSKMVYPGGPQQVGATLTYTINYVNVGSGVAKNVKITDMVPDGTEYIPGTAHDTSGPSATEGYSHDGGLNFNGLESAPVTHVRWEIPEVAGGGTGNGTLEFQVVIK